ncbi:MAG TPA: P1 family peptidase [Nitriliruptorales bacterium]|jgi:L-aminopeptidase/D-esterase-like protein
MALGVDGVRVGTWTSPGRVSGCTVILPPAGSLAALAVRGAAPGTREAIALGPNGKLTVCHGVVLSGSSAYGLATADGVVRWLEEQGIGYAVGPGIVPIVGAAIILDLGVMVPEERPTADSGWQAAEAATTDDPPEGQVGAGTGAHVAKVGGLEHGRPGGQGIAVRTNRDVIVGALVVNNAVGEVIGDDGTTLVGTSAPQGAPRFPLDPEALLAASTAQWGPTQNTVIGAIVTNVRLTKSEAHRVADLGHSGIVRAVRPAHTNYDGDALFCLSTGQVDADLDMVTHLAVEAVAEAARRGPLAAA